MKTDLESLWHSHRTRIFSYVFLRVHDHDVADDLVSSIYLRALVAIRNGHGATSNATAWLFTIARSAMNDHWRSLHHATIVDWESLEGEPDAAQCPCEQAEASILRDGIQRAIAGLTDASEQVVTLRMEGYQYAEIASMTGMTALAARVRGTRAYATLREPVAGLVAFVEAR